VKQTIRPGLISMAGDALAALVGFAIAYWFRFHVYPAYIPGGEPPDPARYVAAAPVVALIVVAAFLFMNVYRDRRGVQFVDELFSVVRAMVVVGVVVFALDGLYREGSFTYSRLTLIYWLVAATLLIALVRYVDRLNRAVLRKRGAGVDKALIVGSGTAADLVIQRIKMFPDYGYHVVGVLADDVEAGDAPGGVQVLGRTRDLQRVVLEAGVDVVFMAAPELSQDRLLELMDSCKDCPTDFRIVPSMLELMTTQVAGDQLDGIPLLQFRSGLDIDASKAASKRVLDIGVAALSLVVLSPLLALIALLVKLSSPGPVLLHQERTGMDGHPLRMHKFRTMRHDAEADTGPVWASPADERRTLLGALLRRLSLDELPQLWNVLKGEMSLVGPRPERPVFVAEFSKMFPGYKNRHRVRPGLTGWAQVNDLRGNTPVEERLIYDLYYIENWSLAFDLKIILITLFRIFTHKNAY
jgi:exopolysaccharide biosynthesis polyprenyl glycosylphosphotransferase